MNKIKSDFIRLALSRQVLRFGEFTLKSGRVSPYFFNAGLFYDGDALKQLGAFYAKTLLLNRCQFETLFGPAYKGLPLATTTAIALSEQGVQTKVAFNRKEIKTHGEGGVLMGAPLSGKTVIIDDVITAGTAFREAKQLIESHGGIVTAVVIALDRCERGQGEHSTIHEIQSEGIAVYSIITLHDLINHLRTTEQSHDLERLLTYQKKYGA